MFEAESPHPASGLCLALGSLLTPFSPPVLGQGGSERMVPSDRSCQSTASLGQLESRPHRPSIFLGEEKNQKSIFPSTAPHQGGAPSTAQLGLAPTRQLPTASAGCSSLRGCLEWLWMGRTQRGWKRAPGTEELHCTLLPMGLPRLAPFQWPTGSRRL